MKRQKPYRDGPVPADDEIPEVTEEDLERFRDWVKAAPRAPLSAEGTVSDCHHCNGRMVTTNNLQYEIATPRGLKILTRLPGAECERCGALQYDSSALAIITEHEQDEVIGDYETKVTTAGGGTLGTYFKADLVRSLGLKGKERLRWRIVGHGKALVEVEQPRREARRRR